MKWEVKYMVDPGDGIVSKEVYENESDNIIDVLADYLNAMEHPYWVFAIEAIPS